MGALQSIVYVRSNVPVIAELLSDLRLPPETVAITTAFSMEIEGEGSLCTVSVDGCLQARGSMADAADAAVWLLNRGALDGDAYRLHLHGAVVDVGGRGVLLAGATGSGKTTVAANLVLRGAGYLSDEIVTLTPGSTSVDAFPKPLTLKRGWMPDGCRLEYSAEGRAALRATTLGQTSAWTTVDLIAFVAFDPTSGGTTLTEVPRHEATRRLLADSLDAVRLGPASLDAVADLVARARCIEVTYVDADHAARALLHNLGPVATGPTDLAVVHCGHEPHPSWRVAVYHDGAVLVDWPSRRVTSLSAKEAEVIRRKSETLEPSGAAATGHWARTAAIGPKSPDSDLRVYRVDTAVSGPSAGPADPAVTESITDTVMAAGCALIDPAIEPTRQPYEFLLPPDLLASTIERIRLTVPCAVIDVPKRARPLGAVEVRDEQGVLAVRLLTAAPAWVRRRPDVAGFVDRSRWERVGGRPCRVVAPPDRFLMASLAAGTRLRPNGEAVAAVARAAPRSIQGAWQVLHLAADAGYGAPVARAIRIAHRRGLPVLPTLVEARVPLVRRLELPGWMVTLWRRCQEIQRDSLPSRGERDEG